MSRVINPETAGKKRKQMVRGVVIALRELMGQGEQDGLTRDLAAFIALSLEAIAKTVEESVAPWEKRGYWVKADRFRMDWDWAERLGGQLKQALLADDWAQVAEVSAKVGEKVSGEHVPKRHRLGTPWVGAWEKLIIAQQ